MAKVKIHCCYCDIPYDRLKELAQMRFVNGITTTELIKQMTSDREREYAAIVALLHISEEDLAQVIWTQDENRSLHFLDCRRHAKKLLEHDGICIKDDRIELK